MRRPFSLLVAVALMVSTCASLSVAAQSPSASAQRPNPYENLFRSQLNPSQKTPGSPDFLSALQQSLQEKTALPQVQTPPICMPVIHGDSSIDPAIVMHGAVPGNGPTFTMRVVQPVPCRK